METIRILHASDLHIALHKQLRSPIDKLKDIKIEDWSQRGIWDKLKTPSTFWTAWRKKIAASSYDPETLRDLAEYIYNHAKKKLDRNGKEVYSEDASIDAVILTGDLATTGSEDDIEQVRNFLFGEYNPKYPHKSKENHYRGATLSAVKIPVVILPGNHDRYEPTLECTTFFYKKLQVIPKFFNIGGNTFDKQLSNFREHPVQNIEIKRNIPNGKTVRIMIFVSDFTLQHFHEHKGFLGWLAQGKVNEDILKRLTSLTQSVLRRKRENEIIHVLWANHFPPMFPKIGNHSKLLGEEKLIQKANDLEVKAILGGHTHQQLKYSSPSMRCEVFCCGSTSQYEPQTIPGGKHEQNYELGNFFQIIKIKIDQIGDIQFEIEHYKYASLGASSFLMGEHVGPNLMSWKKCPIKKV